MASYGIDLDGRVTFVNAAAMQMLGYKQDEMLGHVMHELIHHTRADGTPYDSIDSPIRKSLTNLNTVRVVERGLLAQGWHELPGGVCGSAADRFTVAEVGERQATWRRRRLHRHDGAPRARPHEGRVYLDGLA